MSAAVSEIVNEFLLHRNELGEGAPLKGPTVALKGNWTVLPIISQRSILTAIGLSFFQGRRGAATDIGEGFPYGPVAWSINFGWTTNPLATTTLSRNAYMTSHAQLPVRYPCQCEDGAYFSLMLGWLISACWPQKTSWGAVSWL